MSEITHKVLPLSETDQKKKSAVWKYFGTLLQNDAPVEDNYFYCKICVEEKKILASK